MSEQTPSYRLDDKTAIVTGAGQGIGRATACAFAASGARVAVVDINEDAARETTAMIRSAGLGAETFVIDVTSSAAVAEQFAAIARELGPVDIVVNNAGGGIKQTTIESPDDDWDLVLNLNLRGVINTCRVLWRPMVDHGGGVILNASSQSAHRPMPGLTAYNVAKAGIVHLTKCLAVDGAAHGIRANCIAPGWVLTPAVEAWFAAEQDPQAAHDNMVASDIPIGRMATAEDVAAAYLYLASPAASYVTGVELPVDGGSLLHR
jgi:NAD(P)-dependent dehydrogenase (short-subunit alcohol dehydrogenase family)